MNSFETGIGEKCLEIFASLAKIPHASHHEDEISRFICDYCLAHGGEALRDGVGNVIVEIPPTAGYENRPRVIMQAHMDMVAVAEAGNKFNPISDGITLSRDGDVLTAVGTSLGADDGIGVALILAFLDSHDISHGPLRGIFTVDEEDGMGGVLNLDEKYLKDAKYLINLDSEESDTLTNSCAGGAGVDFDITECSAPPTLDLPLKLTVDGILGGHSGTMIHEGRVNANVAICEFLKVLSDAGIDFELASLKGGTARNAISPTASAKILVDSWDRERVGDLADNFELKTRAEFTADPDFNIEVRQSCMPKAVIEKSAADGTVALATSIVNGVYSMSEKVPGLVEGSSNLGTVDASPEKINLNAFARSCESDVLLEIVRSHTEKGEKYGFVCTASDLSESWPVRDDSPLRDVCLRVYREQNGEDMKVLAIHAGLECGAFARMNPDLDMISIGPDVTDAHSPEEKLLIPSVEKIARLVSGILAELK